MDYSEKKRIVEGCFEDLKKAGKVRTWGELAAALGRDRAGFSAALNSRPETLSDALVAEVVRFRDKELNGTQVPTPAQPSGPADVVVPGATVQMFRDMAATSRSQQETIAAQAQVIDRLVAHLTGAGYAFQGMGGGVAQSSKTEKR